MCLPDFVEFKDVDKSQPLIGYRAWRVSIPNSNELKLMSEFQDYIWLPEYETISHEIIDSNSGIYAYNYDNYNNKYKYNYDNYNNNNYYNNYNNYNYNNNYYNYNYNYNYNRISGIIHQYGKVAIHQIGQRSEYAKIDTLFSIRKSDATGSEKFLDWVDKFNILINDIAIRYNVAKVISWQDFLEQNKSKNV